MINKVIAYIDEHRQAFADRLMELLRIPSISTDPDRKGDVRQAADWVRDLFDNCGMKSEIVKTPGHPSVIAEAGPGNAACPTVLIYGHHDVQPVGEESLWDSPAFEPAVRKGRVFARGAADDKGQVLAHLLAAEAWMKVAGDIPCHAKYLVEGEEEIGSPNLEEVVRKHRDRLACDYVALSDTPKFDALTPAITYGTKGLVYKEIRLTGPRQDLHSGSYGGTITNPGNALAAILSSMRDIHNRVTIPGFYNNVRELTEAERANLAKLSFDETAFRAFTGSPVLDGERGYSTIERRWARPTLDVNGLFGGFVGEGASTIIPSKMKAKVSMRIVPDQDPAHISAAFDQAVKDVAPEGVKVEIVTHASCAAYLCPLDSPGMAAASEAAKAGFGVDPVFIREGGSLPILPLFKEVLGADSLMMGFCDPECNAHGPNEFLALDDFQRGIKAAAHLLDRMARVKR